MSDRCVLCDFPLQYESTVAAERLAEPRRLNCGHLFHIHCTKLALMPGFKCPACQLESPPAIEEVDPPVAKADPVSSESQASEESESSYSDEDDSSDEDYNSDSSSSSVSRSRIDIEESESYSDSSSSEEKPVKRKARKRDASPKKK